MREIRPSGLEGGGAVTPLSLPLSTDNFGMHGCAPVTSLGSREFLSPLWPFLPLLNMITNLTHTMQAANINDTQLVSASLSGDRQAFGQIVEQYQNLVCSIAYNVTGSLSHSEDLAQEAF